MIDNINDLMNVAILNGNASDLISTIEGGASLIAQSGLRKRVQNNLQIQTILNFTDALDKKRIARSITCEILRWGYSAERLDGLTKYSQSELMTFINMRKSAIQKKAGASTGAAKL